ncbi:MAG: glycosyltransferase family 39 protein [Deltaproteobacteria bacterium]|nr:glycosyltransferase family 39 protein [Deltaproteobacteria bacterium]
MHPPSIDPANPNPEKSLADWIRLVLQALIFLGLLLLAFQWRSILDAIQRVARLDWLWLLACSGFFLFLTLLGGSKVPGWINSHGYELLRDVLQVPPTSPDPHGQAWHALHGLFMFLLPRTEASVLIVQIGMAALCIPLIYALVRILFDRRDLARMSALVLAVLPSFAWYAFSEVRPIPGLTFSLLALCVLGLALRVGRLSSWLSASLLGFVATQFYPVFMLLPLPALLLLLNQRRRLGVKLTWRFWTSAALFSSLWLLPVFWISYLLRTGQGIVGPDFFWVLARGYHVLLPDFSEFTSFSGNIWFNHRFTPLILTIASVLGLLLALRRRVWHGSLLTIFGLALLFTLPGLVSGGMNPARLQLAAQPFYVILAAAGLIFAADLVPLRSSVMQLALALLVCLSLIWHPGPIGQTFTPQLERRLFSQGLEQVPESALVVWPPHASGGVNPLPTYLFNYKSLRGATLSGGFAKRFATEENSIVYYRPSSCYLDQNMAFDCAGLEAKLELEPLYLRSLPVRSDYMQDYRKDDKGLIEIGFFRLKGLKVMAR